MSADALARMLGTALAGAGIPFMLTGSLAAAYHGAGRATMDIDLVIDPTREQLHAFVDSLPAASVYVSLDAARMAFDARSMFNVVDRNSGWKADLIVRRDRPFSQVEFERRESAVLFGVSIQVATLEDVVLSKLEWAKLGGSTRQLDDVRTLLRIQSDAIDLAYLERWLDILEVRPQWNAVCPIL